jgi:hypothetical protein
MWEQLTPADIQRARARAAALRGETLNRHAEELRILDAKEAEIEDLERLVIAFSERYLKSAKEVGSPVPEAIEEARSPDLQQHAGPPQLEIRQQISPNRFFPVRRLLSR